MSGVGLGLAQAEEAAETSTSAIMESTMMEGEEYYNPDETGTWTHKETVDQLCRICAKPNQYLIPIFEGEGIEHQLEPKIQKHLPIEVYETDELPLQVCYQCASTLIAWNDLVIACTEADKKLRQMHEQEEDDEDNKGAECFDEPTVDSDIGDDEPVMPSTSTAPVASNSQDDTSLTSKKAASQVKKPKLKMVLVKNPTAGPSGLKNPPKKSLSKSKDVASQDTTERCEQQKAQKPLRRLLPKLPSLPNLPLNDARILLIKVEKSSICGICGISFQLNAELASHIAKTHFGNVFHCEMCNSIRYETKEQFVAHVEDHSNPNPSAAKNTHPRLFLKQKCKKSNTPSNNSTNDIVKPFTCHICGRGVTRSFDLKRHLKTHQPNVVKTMSKKSNIMNCEVCGQTFKRTQALTRHISKVHHSRDVDNKSNGAVLKKSRHQIQSATDNMGKTTFPCKYCSQKLTRNSDLKRHMKKRHPFSFVDINPKNVDHLYIEEDVNKLDYQPNLFLILPPPPGDVIGNNVNPDPETIKKIKKKETLTEETVFGTCFVCKKTFQDQHEYAFHKNAHTAAELAQEEARRDQAVAESKVIDAARVVVDGRTFYSCVQCGKLLVTRYGFERHLRIHSGVKPYTCHVCGKQFSVSIYMYRHIQDVHEQLKRYPCDICGRKFANAVTRNDHRRIHTGERPCVCHICGKTFKTKSSLFVHNKFHSNIFPHKCTVCGKQFRVRQNLNEHILLHTGERPHACGVCGKTFRLHTCLKKHKLIHESKNMEECQICGKFFSQLRYLKNHVRSHFLTSLDG